MARLAVEYRQAFGQDVVIDMVCYRRRGHNEGDDPSMTNPSMYQIIDGKRSVRKIYTEALIGRGDLSGEDAEEALRDYHTQLERVFNEVRELERALAAPSPSVEAEQPIPTEVGHQDHRWRRCTGSATPHVELPEGFTLAPAGQVGAGAPGRDVPRRRDRLGVRRAARPRARSLMDGRLVRLSRPGHQARHLRAAARGPDRPAAPARNTFRCSTFRTIRPGS